MNKNYCDFEVVMNVNSILRKLKLPHDMKNSFSHFDTVAETAYIKY